MKKKALALLLCAVLLLTACGPTPGLPPATTLSPTDAYGNRVTHMSGKMTVFADELPAIIDYNDDYVTVKSMVAYDSEVNYEHTLYVVVTIDYSALSESDFHWFLEEDFDISAYVTHEKNGYDFKRLAVLGKLYDSDTNTLWVVLNSSFFDTNRYDFSGADIVLSVDVEQVNGGSNGDSGTGDCIALHHSDVLPDKLPNVEAVGDLLYSWIVKWLGDYADYIGSLTS